MRVCHALYLHLGLGSIFIKVLMTVYYYKDRFHETGEQLLPIQERAYNFGDGVYELVRFYHGQPFCLMEHLQRFKDSAEAIRMALPYTLEELQGIIVEAVARVAEPVVDVYFQVSRGEAPRLHTFPATDPVLSLFAKPNELHSDDERKQGVSVLMLEDQRWSNCYIKSLNLLPNILAKQAAVEAGAYEAVLFKDGHVTEASASNVFAYADGAFWTAPVVPGILNGITRRCIIRAIHDLGLELREEWIPEPFFRNEVQQAFVTSTTMEIMPINSIAGRKLPPVEEDAPLWRVLETMRGLGSVGV
jgi:D-alanine transaminase